MPGQYSSWGNHQRTPLYWSQPLSLVLCFMASPVCPTPAGQVPPPPEGGGVPRGQHKGKGWVEPGTFPWGMLKTQPPLSSISCTGMFRLAKRKLLSAVGAAHPQGFVSTRGNQRYTKSTPVAEENRGCKGRSRAVPPDPVSALRPSQARSLCLFHSSHKHPETVTSVQLEK